VKIELGLALLLTAAAPGSAAEWNKTFTLSGTPELRLEASDATITVTGEDRTNIAARVTTVGWKISDHDVRILENQAGNVLEIEVIAPESNFSLGRHALRVELKVPRQVNCEVKGGVGTVVLTGVQGKTVMESKAGTIEALDLDGKLEATTGEGKIRARGRFDLVTLHSGFGAIDVEATSGSRMFAAWRVGTDDGNVTLRLPSGFAADLDVQTDAGHITIDFPYTISGTPDQSRIQGKMNAGGEALVLRTSGGNIKILKNRGT
jgi:predicted amino acid-binding ACT domain protein